MERFNLEMIRKHRWPLIMALLFLSSASWLVWFWQRGILGTSVAATTQQPSEQERSMLQQLQEKNDALEAQVQQLQASGVRPAVGTSTATSPSQRVNINTADQAELESLPGIGASKAAAIIEYRQSHGAFQTPHDITKVKGIGESTYEQLKDSIAVSSS